ncbi:MAG: hypothetical protein R2731_02025 [Nocardioides sp.]
MVKAAALAHGVRRAASPESRFKMRYVYTREVTRARRQRKAEARRARRRRGSASPGTGREDAA